ncbi:MAG TPA: mycofactocin biosynthesis glycosyltransferase MftF [Mycobacteriales bacterium]|nr:mycofactocin biosynthesis glycosyltransferase MftF [Mycobacteriales bacterium]
MPPLPPGFRLRPDRSLRAVEEGAVLCGGTPWRLLRLTPAGAERARQLLDGRVVADAADAALARRLLAAGLAHPFPPGAQADGPDQPPQPGAARRTVELEVVIPVRDRADGLDRCLHALALGDRVTVVDDGSANAAAVRVVTDRHGARLVRRPQSRGPAAARNAGLAATTGEVVAFVDSDVDVSAEALQELARQLADPTVAAVAPRVRPAPPASGHDSVLARFTAARPPLDLGPDPAAVRPGGRLTFVPSTVLVARRAALEAVGGFDEQLRFGEDVDLCWRLTDAGWTVRYDPSLAVAHLEPVSWWQWFTRIFRYGSSAGPLARRHGPRLAGPALVGLVAPVRLARHAREGRIPAEVARDFAAEAPARTLLALARWAVPLWWPVLVVAAWRRRSLRLPLLVALAGPLVVEWRRRRPRGIHPLEWAAGAVADDAAYGAGIWWGCVRSRTLWPVLPRWRARAGGAGAEDGDPVSG